MENQSVAKRKKMVRKSGNISVRRQCKLLRISRSSFYIKSKGYNSKNLHLMSLMDEHFINHPTKGVLQMQDFLKSKGHNVNVKRIRRLLRLMGIEALYPKRNLSRLGKSKYIKPYLLRNRKISNPNEVWAIDISYIPMQKGFMYLTAVIDLYSRYVVGWQLSNTLEVEIQTELIDQLIIQYGKPDIINSDQGSQYTSLEWAKCLDKWGIQISMDGKGRATDNAFVERLFRSVKQEYVYLHSPENGQELFEGFKNWFTYYNQDRTHQGIGRITPMEKYKKVI